MFRRAPYISPALDDLAAATIALLLGEERASFYWQAEPGKYQALLLRDGDVVQLRLHERATDIFFAEDLLLNLAVQVRRQLRQLRNNHNLDGYEASWQRPLPVEHQKRLETPIQEKKAKPSAT